jgi:hypothetical protein
VQSAAGNFDADNMIPSIKIRPLRNGGAIFDNAYYVFNSNVIQFQSKITSVSALILPHSRSFVNTGCKKIISVFYKISVYCIELRSE